MWGWIPQYGHTVFFWSMLVAAVFGGIGIGATLISAVVAYQLSEWASRDANERISITEAAARRDIETARSDADAKIGIARSDADAKIGVARSDADTKIGVAREEARVAVEKARADIANADKAREEAQTDAAEARRQTAALENQTTALVKEATTARLELERVRNQLAARRLSRAQADTIIKSLAGKSVTFSQFGWNPEQEAQQFALELWSTLDKAGARHDQTLPGVATPGFGVVVSAPPDSPDFRHVTQALTEAGIPFVRGPSTAHLQIYVGTKPPLTLPVSEPR